MSQQTQFPRFSLDQRIEHWIAVTGFTVLAVTGLPQKFVGAPWAESMIAALGGIETVRIIHRYAAVILIVQSLYHAIAIAYRMLVQRTGLSMMFGWKDMTDLFGVMAYNLGLSKARPKMPRFNFEEKMEYWAFIWGTVLMVATGFMLWNPIATANFVPGSFIPAAKAAHGGEALLAVLAIIVWHMWGVHLRKFNKSMFTGKLSRAEMAHEHALELEAIESGTARPPEPAEAVAKRAKIFVPVAAVIAVVLLFGLYQFVTFEETAIPTVAAAASETNSYQPLEISAGGGSLHTTIAAYNGPESCAASGCHDGGPIESATASAHSQRIAAAGPNPLLAHLVSAEAAAQGTPDCLLCHAQTYQTDDLTAAARTARAAGGQTCRRCHNNHPDSDVHTEAGLACVSCHTAANHEIKTEVDCRQCHTDLPHTDPLLNSKHQRLDCRTCHAPAGLQIAADAGAPVKDAVTGFFQPSMTTATGTPVFVWTKEGQPASLETEGAKIVPLQAINLMAPAALNPFNFALTGQADGAIEETVVNIVPSHGVTRENARTCAQCHGPAGDMDFLSLGYTAEEADNLSAVPPAETE